MRQRGTAEVSLGKIRLIGVDSLFKLGAFRATFAVSMGRNGQDLQEVQI